MRVSTANARPHWEDTIEMIRAAEKMAQRMPPPGQAVTYRLRAGTLRKRIALAWRVLWAGNVTIRISSNARLETERSG